MEQNKSFNEHPHPCVGVMYPAFLNDVEPAEGRDLPPDDSADVYPTIGVFYPEWLDELDPMYDGLVETVNKPFDTSRVLFST